MKIKGEAPEWATELFKKVCKDYNRGLPSLFIWSNRSARSSSGYTRPHWYTAIKYKKDGTKYLKHHYGELCVRAGTDVQDQTLVLLHELAHHIVGRTKKGRNSGHSIAFWKLAFELYDKYGVDMDYAFKREKNYKVKATQAYEYHIAKKEAV